MEIENTAAAASAESPLRRAGLGYGLGERILGLLEELDGLGWIIVAVRFGLERLLTVWSWYALLALAVLLRVEPGLADLVTPIGLIVVVVVLGEVALAERMGLLGLRPSLVDACSKLGSLLILLVLDLPLLPAVQLLGSFYGPGARTRPLHLADETTSEQRSQAAHASTRSR